jgi:hypothetical protein
MSHRRRRKMVTGASVAASNSLWVMLRSFLICGWPAGTVLICYPIVVSTRAGDASGNGMEAWNEPNLPAADPRTLGATSICPGNTV